MKCRYIYFRIFLIDRNKYCYLLRFQAQRLLFSKLYFVCFPETIMRSHSSNSFFLIQIFIYRDFKLFSIKFHKNILSCFINNNKNQSQTFKRNSEHLKHSKSSRKKYARNRGKLFEEGHRQIGHTSKQNSVFCNFEFPGPTLLYDS